MKVPRQVPLADVLAMLDACAPGHSRRASVHHVVVTWNGRTYPGLPLGKHGRRDQNDIGSSQVRSLVRHLEIPAECAAKHLPSMAQAFLGK